MSTDIPEADAAVVETVALTPAPAAPAPTPPAPKPPKKPISVYTVMLGISLFAICLAVLFLFLEWNSYNREIIPNKPLF